MNNEVKTWPVWQKAIFKLQLQGYSSKELMMSQPGLSMVQCAFQEKVLAGGVSTLVQFGGKVYWWVD
jgi:ABC-type uncharacterized transport system permease subunit